MRYLLIALILSACAMPPASPAVSYLRAQYNPDTGLLRESPETAPNVHWIQTDNRLCIWALSPVAPDLAMRLRFGLLPYPQQRHGMIEILRGEVGTFPPYVPAQNAVKPSVWTETRTHGATMPDWAEYADLALYAALSAYNAGDGVEALRLYADAVKMWDGVGFRDRAFDGRYASYKLALAVIVANKIGGTIDPEILGQLSRLQADTGGYFAHYTADGAVGDTNTESTCYALLAQS